MLEGFDAVNKGCPLMGSIIFMCKACLIEILVY